MAQLDLVRARAQAQLVDQQTRSANDGSVPSARTFDEYVNDRVQNQANSHRRKSDEHARQARTLRTAGGRWSSPAPYCLWWSHWGRQRVEEP
jgi:hypothetical protein